MRVTLYHQAHQPWLEMPEYQEMVANRNVKSRAAYATDYDFYHGEVARVAQINRNLSIEVERALIGGIGDSSEEVELLVAAFPELKELSIVDWHRPNLDRLKSRLADTAFGRQDITVSLYHADLGDFRLSTLVDFVFANKLLDLFTLDPLSTRKILLGIHQALKEGRLFFSLDYPLNPDRVFYNLAEQCGLRSLYPRIFFNM